MKADENHLYILFSDKSMEKVSVTNLEEVVAKTDKLNSLGAKKGEAVDIAVFCDILYVADNKGFVHRFNSGDLTPVAEDVFKSVYGHACHSVAASADGKFVACGDVKGNTTIFDAESAAQVSYAAYNKNKILALDFTPDSKRIMAVGFDATSYVCECENTKVVIKIKSK